MGRFGVLLFVYVREEERAEVDGGQRRLLYLKKDFGFPTVSTGSGSQAVQRCMGHGGEPSGGHLRLGEVRVGSVGSSASGWSPAGGSPLAGGHFP